MSRNNSLPAEASIGDIGALIQAVDRLVRSMAVQDAPKLWSMDDIASWMGLSIHTVRLRIVTQPDFPPPLIPSGDGVKSQKRWFADDVVGWARRQAAGAATASGRSRALGVRHG